MASSGCSSPARCSPSPPELQGEALGFAAPCVLVPHPVQDRTDAELQAVADACYAQVLAAVTAG